MYCTLMLTIASIKMFVRNRQALFFSLFMPMLILFTMGSMEGNEGPGLKIGVVTHSPTAGTARFVEGLRSTKALEVSTGSLSEELKKLHAGDRTAVLDVPDDLLTHGRGGPVKLPVYVNEGRPIEAQTALSLLDQIADHTALAAAAAPAVFTVSPQSIRSHNFRYIEFLLPGVMAMGVMQMCVFSVAFVFTRYREMGILKRLMATPMRPVQFVTANIITRLLMALAQAGIFVAVGLGYFHVHVAGSYWLLGLCVTLGSLMFLGLGFGISGVSKSIETTPLIANLVVFPMLFLGNVFFSISNMPPWLRHIAEYLPLTYLASGLRGVMSDGEGFAGAAHDIAGMGVWVVLLIVLAVYTFSMQEPENA